MTVAAADDELLGAVSNLLSANETYRAALASNAAQLRECIRRLEDGEEVVTVVRSLSRTPSRGPAKSADDAMNEARNQFRTRLITACVAGGMSRREIAASMGVTQQLVSRYLKADNR
jgi:ribosome-binding protein aMBF1 (putative translation factor)